MKSWERRLQKVEKRFMPALETAFDRKLLRRIEAGRRRVRQDRQAHGMSDSSNEGWLASKSHTARGSQLIVNILHEGRERNHLRWLRDKQPHPSGPLVPTAEENRGRIADNHESSTSRSGAARATTTSRNSNAQLANEVSKYFADLLGFVLACFPWGEKGTALENYTGPDKWQRQELEEIGTQVRERGFDGHTPVEPIRRAIASGHGIGKSALTAFIVLWLMSTRPYAQGTVTANTYMQLETKTWAAIQKWHKLCLTGPWFICTTQRLYHKDAKESWFCAPATCKEENSEAFAGQHAATSSSFYVFDEASAVPDKIFEVAEGGTTDGHPFIFLFGNPTRSSGKFYRVCFGNEQERWAHKAIDSRDCALPNKVLIGEWVETYGEDSDFVRVRVRGLPPAADELQFIDRERILAAQKRPALSLPDDPLICGVDVSGGGAAWNVCAFRRSLDARSIPRIRIPGEHTRDRSVLVAKLAEILSDERPNRKVAAMFIDMAFGSPIYERLRQLGFTNVHETNFGLVHTPDRSKANMRAYMWDKTKDWLLHGAIPDDEKLASDLAGPGYHINRSNQLVLESKADMQKRGQASPDDGDALCLTFAQPVAPVKNQEPDEEEAFSRFINFPSGGHGSWMR